MQFSHYTFQVFHGIGFLSPTHHQYRLASRPFLFLICIDDTHTSIAGILFSKLIGNFGQSLRFAHTRRNRDTGSFRNSPYHAASIFLQIDILEARKIKERLIDRVNFNIGREVREQSHHTARHIPIQILITGANANSIF